MPNNDLIKWIQRVESQGFKGKELYKYLLHLGYKEEDIKEAIELTNKNPIKKETGFIQRIKQLISNPKLFFEISVNDNFQKTRHFFMLFLGIIILVQLFQEIIIPVFFTASNSLSKDIVNSFIGIIIFSMVFIIFFGFSFIVTGIFHFIGKIMGFKSNYLSTYKSVVYGSVPFLFIEIFRVIPFYDNLLILNIYFSIIEINIFSLWSIILISIGFSRLHQINRLKSIIVVLIPVFLICLISIIFGSVKFTGLFF